MIKKIFSTRTDYPHLIYLFVLFGLVTPIIVGQVYPLMIAPSYGSAILDNKFSLSAAQKTLWLFSGLIFLSPFILFKVFSTYNNRKFAKTKNYIFLILFILLISWIIVLLSKWKIV
jgi:hypothetical protein